MAPVSGRESYTIIRSDHRRRQDPLNLVGFAILSNRDIIQMDDSAKLWSQLIDGCSNAARQMAIIVNWAIDHSN